MKEKKKVNLKKRALTSVLLLLFALVTVTAVTVAWFSISDYTRLSSVHINVTTGISMRFDLDAHADFYDYLKTLTFDQIADRVLADQGYDMRETALEPVTTTDGVTYTFEHGELVESDSGVYYEFVLHFIADRDMVVHLTSADGTGDVLGTLVSSDTAGLVDSMRLSFEADGQIWVFDPGMGDTFENVSYGKIFGLPSEENMVYNVTNALFSLKADEDLPVTVRIWVEGTDENNQLFTDH